jgi:putative tricarboxylic transport membrane protein
MGEGRVGVRLTGNEGFCMEEKIGQRPGERILLWFLLVFSIFVLIQALRIPRLENLSSSGAFPIFIGLVLIGSSLRILWKNRERYTTLRLNEELRQATTLIFPRTVTVYTGILILYILLLYPLHFWISSALFLMASFVILKAANIWKSLMIVAGTLIAVYLVFQYIFKVILW